MFADAVEGGWSAATAGVWTDERTQAALEPYPQQTTGSFDHCWGDLQQAGISNSPTYQEPDNVLYYCQHVACGGRAGYQDPQKLRKHMRIHDKRFLCKYCDKLMADRRDLRRHHDAHERTWATDPDVASGRFSCKLCPGRNFTLRWSLQRHMKKQHSSYEQEEEREETG